MTSEAPLAPPGGMAPPVEVLLPGGTRLGLPELAEEISRRHLQAHPEELERYGEAGREWCRHDNQHLLNWAVLDLGGSVSFPEQLDWLANVLTSRGYPLANLCDNLETAAEVVRERVPGTAGAELGERLERSSARLKGRHD